MNITFDHDEELRIRTALLFCPVAQHNEIFEILKLYRFYASMLESILDGYVRIEYLDHDGLHVSLTPAGKTFAEETMRNGH